MKIQLPINEHFAKNIMEKISAIRKVEAELNELYGLEYKEQEFDLELSHAVDCRLLELKSRLELAKRCANTEEGLKC